MAGAMALLGGSALAATAAQWGDFGPMLASLQGISPDTQEEREQRNAMLGGRKKRIHNQQSLRSLRKSRIRSVSRPPNDAGKVFKSTKRNEAFFAALVDGKSRNDALKLARRVAA